jgi:RNA polymerase sigma factor (sigma-70 family)
MCLEDNHITDQNVENMFGVYIKKVIVRSRKRFDSIIHAHTKHEELILNTATPGFKEDDITQLEGAPLAMEESMVIDPLQLETAFTDKNMYEAVKGLSSKQKYILFFIYFEEKSEQEIADIFGLTRQAVNKTKQTALKRIMDKYIEVVSKV